MISNLSEAAATRVTSSKWMQILNLRRLEQENAEITAEVRDALAKVAANIAAGNVVCERDGVPLDDVWAISVFGKARTPFYENSDGYRGSIEALIAPRLNFRPSSRLSFFAGATVSYFGRSHWDATGTDPNSGAVQGYASFGAGYIFGENVTASLTVQLPLFTELLGNEDGLEGAPVYGLSVSRQF